jgi:aminopeptidase N
MESSSTSSVEPIEQLLIDKHLGTSGVIID